MLAPEEQLRILKSGVYEIKPEDKLLEKLRMATNKRPVTEKQLRTFAYSFEDDMHTPELTSEDIGRRSLLFLKDLDDVAYIRFMSVYHDFDSVDRFIEEIRELDENRPDQDG